MFVSSVAQNVEGRWNGTLNAGAMKLPLVVNVALKDGLYSATIDSPSQGAKGIPASAVKFENAKFSFSIAALGVEYEGAAHGDSVDSIVGTFKQNGLSFPLTFTRSKAENAALPRPQEPKKPYPYKEEEVRFENKAAGVVLAGTLTMPTTGTDFPTAVLVSGSGPQNRNEELLGHKTFLVLSDYLTRNGIAALRYDDRGTGESSGDYSAAGIDDMASDAAAAVEYLATRKDINPQKTGIIGHSEGGTIAFLLAGKRDSRLSFIVSMAGMAIPGDSLLKMQRRLLCEAQGITEEYIAKQEAIIEIITGLIDKYPADYILQNINRLADEVLPEEWRGNETIKQTIQRGVNQMKSVELQSIMKCNPAEALRGIKCRVLALNGEKDLQVPADANLERIKALVESPVTAKKYPGLNHLFQHCATGLPHEYGNIGETIAPEALKDMAEWIKNQ
jgi:fermentation-respiration switch protein FrsA (DUF1100 family)